MSDATYIESREVAVAGTNIGFNDVIKRTESGVSAVVNLTGKTIRATIRRSARPSTVINATLEDMAIVSTGTLTLGECEWTLDDLVSTHMEALCPADPTRTAMFDLQYYIVEDDYYPQIHRFPCRKATD